MNPSNGVTGFIRYSNRYWVAAVALALRLGIWFGRVREWGTDAEISADTTATDCLLARQVRLVLISCSGLHGRMTLCGGWAYVYTAQTARTTDL